ncbi:hypothetical protein SDRG_01889 [Saprolegnia diclina VS20]|uniref:Lipoyl-binding domain-containing protein n=1 Tax=Saprolegnia diclina (strain VS20) TaxID=1156394 RepID=T0R1I0_SAPDV|nr:hypothetical protein SDRG_01889 [Saprolegnia diclina VS20]EQC40821.1 hypothetical protein SDRG_01889 [Saprolegnia diclina VS20]|eukprot:XP_008605665.1 hypothetical protein SDRG_01889 [Saprolegnia diclina VS20]
MYKALGLSSGTDKLMLHKLKAVRAPSHFTAGRRVPALSSATFNGIRLGVPMTSVAHVQVATPNVARREFSTTDVPVPSMGNRISESTVVKWVKAVGDSVEVDEVVVVLETDKLSVDVRSPQAGVVVKHLATVGATALVGAPLFRLTKGATSAASTPAPPTGPDTVGVPITIKVPSMGDKISEATVASWAKDAGDHVDVDEVVLVLETEKVTVDVRAPSAGVMQKQLVKVEDVVKVGARLFHMVPNAALTATQKRAAAVKAAALQDGNKAGIRSVLARILSGFGKRSIE